MGKNKHITNKVAAQIVMYRDVGWKQNAIAEKLNIYQSVVSRTVKRYRHSKTFSQLKKTDRPRVTSERTDNLIKRIVTKQPTSSQIYFELPLTSSVSCRTIRRRLHDEFDLKSYRPNRMILTQKRNYAKLLATAVDLQGYYRNIKDWVNTCEWIKLENGGYRHFVTRTNLSINFTHLNVVIIFLF